MIVGSYSLHLYCDYPDDSYEHRGSSEHSGPGFLEIASEETFNASMRVARQAGWKFSKGSRYQRKAICAWCLAKKRKLKDCTGNGP